MLRRQFLERWAIEQYRIVDKYILELSLPCPLGELALV